MIINISILLLAIAILLLNSKVKTLEKATNLLAKQELEKVAKKALGEIVNLLRKEHAEKNLAKTKTKKHESKN